MQDDVSGWTTEVEGAELLSSLPISLVIQSRLVHRPTPWNSHPQPNQSVLSMTNTCVCPQVTITNSHLKLVKTQPALLRVQTEDDLRASREGRDITNFKPKRKNLANVSFNLRYLIHALSNVRSAKAIYRVSGPSNHKCYRVNPLACHTRFSLDYQQYSQRRSDQGPTSRVHLTT